jgi:hypothetical protein
VYIPALIILTVIIQTKSMLAAVFPKVGTFTVDMLRVYIVTVVAVAMQYCHI